jgi:signal transduction histidine kinase
MPRIKFKLTLFNVLSKLIFAGIFILLMPYIIQRINLRQTDNDLVRKREQVIALIQEAGIEPFIVTDSNDAFGSFNILKDEYISIERISNEENLNYIEDMPRIIEGDRIEYRVLVYSFIVDSQKYLLEVGKSQRSIIYMENNTRKIMLLFLIFFLVITSFTDWQYTRVLLKPLDRITRKLRRISDPLKFDRTPVKTTTTDFIDLDKSLRELMERIDLLFVKEKETTVNISHELLTPISVMRSKLENLILREDAGDEVKSKIEESLKTLHRLQSLVNSLLLIARIESHQYLREESVSMREIIEGIINEIDPIAADSGIILKNELKEDYILSNANRSLIFSMLYNVINNSVQNSSAGGNVIVSGYSLNGFVVIVADNGRGLSPEQMKNLFSRFRMRTQDSGRGTGVGLAIAKSIADFHQIKIEVESEPGKGTKIFFTFPEIS